MGRISFFFLRVVCLSSNCKTAVVVGAMLAVSTTIGGAGGFSGDFSGEVVEGAQSRSQRFTARSPAATTAAAGGPRGGCGVVCRARNNASLQFAAATHHAARRPRWTFAFAARAGAGKAGSAVATCVVVPFCLASSLCVALSRPAYVSVSLARSCVRLFYAIAAPRIRPLHAVAATRLSSSPLDGHRQRAVTLSHRRENARGRWTRTASS